jgi:hypothetical protein
MGKKVKQPTLLERAQHETDKLFIQAEHYASTVASKNSIIRNAYVAGYLAGLKDEQNIIRNKILEIPKQDAPS